MAGVMRQEGMAGSQLGSGVVGGQESQMEGEEGGGRGKEGQMAVAGGWWGQEEDDSSARWGQPGARVRARGQFGTRWRWGTGGR